MRPPDTLNPLKDRGFTARHQHWLLALLLLVALLVRLPNLQEPPFYRSTRPYIGLMQARHLYYQMDPPAETWRAEVAADFFRQSGMLELPVQSLVAALLYMLLGQEQIWVAQFLPVLAWSMGAVFLFRLGRIWLSPLAALAATTFHLFAPFGIGLSRMAQPDALMTALLLGSWWALAHWQQEPETGRLRILAAFGFAVILVKPTCAPLVAVPVALVFWHAHDSWLALLRGRVFWSGLILPLGLASGYYIYRAMAYPDLGKQAEMSFVLSLYLAPQYLVGWWYKLGESVGIIPLLLALAGNWSLTNRTAKWFMASLWTGYLVYGLVFNYHISTHDYYSLPLLPVIALGLGAGLDRLATLRPAQKRIIGAGTIVLLFTLGGSAYVCWQTLRQPTEAGKERSRAIGRWWGVSESFLEVLRPAHGQARSYFQTLREIGDLVEHSRHCIFLTRDYATALRYHGEVGGLAWPMTVDLEGKTLRGQPVPVGTELLARYQQNLQAQYFIVTNPWELLQQKDLTMELSTRHELVVANDRYRIYRLR